MAGVGSRAWGKMDNLFGFADKEKQEKEFSDGNGLEWYDFETRMYDPQTGRFHQMDPLMEYMRSWTQYQYCYNNPLRFTDDTGMMPGDTTRGAMFGGELPIVDPTDASGQTLAAVQVTATKNNKSSFEFLHATLGFLGLFDQSGLTDLLDATLYALEGDYKNAAISAIAAIPFGDIAKGLKYADEVEEVAAKEIKAVKKNPCGCFLAGTLILTDTGSVSVEKIKIGDKVWAFNDTTGKYELKKVKTLFRYTRDTVYQVAIGTSLILTTSDHPFLALGRWIKVKDLKAGDSLQSYTGKKVVVRYIRIVPGRVTVYNFEVEDFHTYFVSPLQVLVHNNGACDVDLSKYGQAKHLKGEPGVYVHIYKKGKKTKTYTGQSKDLGGARPKKSRRQRLKTATKEGYTYSKTKLIPLKGSGHKTLNSLEAATLEARGGASSTKTFNLNEVPKNR